jgi:hypothetical protein
MRLVWTLLFVGCFSPSEAQPCERFHGRAYRSRADSYLSLCPIGKSGADFGCFRVLDDASDRLLDPNMGTSPTNKALIGYFRICHVGDHGGGSAENVIVKSVTHWHTVRVP